MALFSWRFIIPLIIFVFCYWKIFAALRRSSKVSNIGQSVSVSSREQNTAGPSTSAAAAAAAAAAADPAPAAGSRSKPLNKSQRNVIKTMIAVTSCFIVCWLPLQFAIVAGVCGLRPVWNRILYNALLVVAFVNFSANPFIYATGLYQFLRAQGAVLLYRLSRRESQVATATE